MILQITSYAVEPVYYGHLGTNDKSPDYQGILIFHVSLYDIAPFGTITISVWIMQVSPKCVPGFFCLGNYYACVFIFMCVCLPLRLLITSGMIWTLYDWLAKFCSFYTAAVVDIISRCGLNIDTHCTNQPNNSKLVLYKTVFQNICKCITIHNTSVVKVCVVCMGIIVSMCLKKSWLWLQMNSLRLLFVIQNI